jgi:diguanylate cyclase (GGDEF)-like protein
MKLLAVLIPVMAISLFVAIGGLGEFLHDFFQRRAELETGRLGQAVQLAIRQSMLRTPESVLNDTLTDLEKTPSLRRVWIIDKRGRVSHAADTTMIGRVLDKARDPICTVCHAGGATPQAHTFFTRDDAGTPILRHVSPIANERVCWGCHDAKSSLNGILLLEESTEPFQRALGTVQRRLGATGVITLLALALMTLLATTVLVQRPVQRLMAGVRQLGTGDLTVRVPVRGRDELSVLATSFNSMTEDLGRSMEEIQNKNAELSVVYSILARLTETINLAELKEIILQTLLNVLEADRVLLMSNLLTLQEPVEVLFWTRGVSRPGRLAWSGQHNSSFGGFPREIADQWLRGELQEPFVTATRQMAVIPTQIRNSKLALLLIERERPFGQPEANPKLLRALADHIGVAFENARLFSLAITDELTQLFTSRHLQNRLEDEISRYKRHGQKFCLLMLDLDHFKAINDRWGHLAGDEVLRQVAQTLLGNVRAVDSAYRYGGEEFAILLPETDPAGARVAAERMRQGVENLQISLGPGKSVGVTTSIGIALCPQNGVSAQELLAAADKALYDAKRQGRNCVSGPASALPDAPRPPV